MSFLEFMISSMEYTDISALFGLWRVILWGLTHIVTSICNIIEEIYNHIFALFGVIYSDKVMGFIKGWVGYLWIPIAISIIVLGYNLIMANDGDGNVKVKTFARNLCLFALILFGLPYLFLGPSSSASDIFVTGSAGTTESGLVEVFSEDEGSGIVKGIAALGSNQENASHTYSVVTDNVYDLILIYTQVQHDQTGISSTWSQDMLESGKIRKNAFQYIGEDGAVHNKKGDSIMSIDIGYSIDFEYVDDMMPDDIELKKVIADGYDDIMRNAKDGMARYLIANYDNINPTARAQMIELLNNDELNDSARDYLFQYVHKEVIRNLDDNGNVIAVSFSNDGETKSGLIGGIFSKFPFRYKVEWGIMFIQLISTGIVLLLTTYKIARIIFEIVVNHFLVLFFGAADLSNGQRVKEVLKSIISLLLSLLFAVVLVEFYFIVSSSVSTITFIKNDSSANKWMQALVNFFVAIAAVKGPSVLEKVLGIEGGLSGAWHDMGTATRPMRQAAKAAGRGAIKLAKGAAIAGGAIAYNRHEKHKAIKEAREEHQNGNQSHIGGGRDKSRTEVAGNEAQFAAARKDTVKDKVNNKLPSNLQMDTDKGKSTEEKLSTASGRAAANAEMARQSRDIGSELKNSTEKKTSGLTGETRETMENRVANETANRYRSNIQNAAMAEQAKARTEGKALDDKDALKRAYENSGFTSQQAEALASRDNAGGSFTEKKEKFENSISAKAQQKMADSPLNYSNQMQAYTEAASDHYKALGFDDSTANTMAVETAQRVLVDDKQERIRTRAQEMRRVDMSSVDSQDAPKRDETYYLESATKEILGDASVGFNGSYDGAVTHIMSQGTLREGMVSGRLVNNVARERAETNTRAGAFASDTMNPGVKAGATIIGGYFVERGMEAMHSTGRESGRRSYEKNTSKRTDKQYKNLKKSRNKNK